MEVDGQNSENSYIEIYEVTIQDLPSEIRVKILDHLGPDKVHLRLVCKRWKEELDSLSSFALILNENHPKWPFLFPHRISTLVIDCLRTFTQISLPHLPILHSLILNGERTNEVNLFHLLAQTSPHLNYLQITSIHYPLLSSSFSNFINVTLNPFDRLKTLNLAVDTTPDPSSEFNPLQFLTLNRQENFFTEILVKVNQHLTNCFLTLHLATLKEVKRFTKTIVELLAFTSNLQVFDLELSQGNLPFHPMQLQNEEEESERIIFNCDQLNTLRLVNGSTYGGNYWAELLKIQKTLKYLELDLLPLERSVFVDAVSRNFSTIVSIDISDLTVWEGDFLFPFDCLAFSKCGKLKKLTLDRNVGNRRIQNGESELINLYLLPNTLEELGINYFNVLSDEFLIYFSETDRELKSLTLTQVGSEGEFGVNGSVVEKIINLENIQFIETSNMNFSNEEEREKLNLILSAFGYAPDHFYFQLTRTQGFLQMAILDLNSLDEIE